MTPGEPDQTGGFCQSLVSDAYVEGRRDRAAWSTRVASSQYEAPLGRSITDAALDASGRFVAVSTTTVLNIGAIRDTVVVMRARDGAERFRRSLATYTRSVVAFLGADRFAYSSLDAGHGRTHVLRVAE